MKGNYAAGLHVPPVNSKRLRRDQMHRDRVARERVDDENVELPARFAFEREPRVAEHDLDFRVAVLQVRKVAAGDGQNVGIDLVEAEHVVLRTPGGKGARTEADDADLERRDARMQRFEQSADT